jgi:glycosyltransferase involved in cell wall biosynthesis
MIHDLFPNYTMNAAAEIEMKRRAVLNAQAVICISENTKQDLLNLYSIPERKVSVIHLASGIDATLSHGHDPVPTNPYFLYVGMRAGYKNFDRLLRAFANAFGSSTEITLCVVGSQFSPNEQELIAQLNLRNRIEFYGEVSDTQLAKLYRCSVGFVYPSLYEGFGIPLLEAMSCGTAVIASNCSSIPEVVGDAGVCFDPTSVDEMSAALLLLANNPTYRERLVEKGQNRARMFSWEKTVEQTLNVYQSVQN